MKANKRAYRRAQRDRLKHKRVRDNYYGLGSNRTAIQLSFSVDTAKDCSCMMCCNRRKVEGLTVSEKASIEGMQYAIKHLD